MTGLMFKGYLHVFLLGMLLARLLAPSCQGSNSGHSELFPRPNALDLKVGEDLSLRNCPRTCPSLWISLHRWATWACCWCGSLKTSISATCSGLHGTPGLPSFRQAVGKDLRTPAPAGCGGSGLGGAAGLPGAQVSDLVERAELLGVLLLLPLCDAVHLYEALVRRGRPLNRP